MLPINPEEEHKGPITPVLKDLYSDLNPVPLSPSYYKLFQAKSLLTQEIHTIRVLDRDSLFVQSSFEAAATIFIQEIMRLCAIHPNEVLIDTFQFYDKNICIATKSFLPLDIVRQNQKETQLNVDKLLEDLPAEVQFMKNQMRFKAPDSIIQPKNVFQLSDGSFFIGDWSKALEGGQVMNLTDSDYKAGENDSEEIYALGAMILELTGMPHEDVVTLNEIQNLKLYNSAVLGFIDMSMNVSEQSRTILKSMVSKDPSQRLHLKELLSKYRQQS